MQNIFLDEHDVPKLSNFGFSVSIPEGRTHIEVHQIWYVGYNTLKDSTTGKVTEKDDVYNFGVLLLEL